ncbi:late embryogenesis abundant protein 2-like [Fagus crenata]
MASQGQDSIGYKAGQITVIYKFIYGIFFFFNYVNITPLIVQVKKGEFLNQASDTAQSTQNSSPNLSGQATNFLQQTGEQVKNMAQEAAVVVKNTLGMNTDNKPNSPNYRSNTNNPSSISNPSNTNDPSNINNPNTISNPTIPSTRI